MTFLLYIIGLTISAIGAFYIMSNKKKLSDENILEFEKIIKPKLVKLLLLSFIPMLTLCAYILSEPESFSKIYFAYTGLSILLFSAFGYYQAKKTINIYENVGQYNYTLNYFIFIGIGQLFILAGITYGLKDYLTN